MKPVAVPGSGLAGYTLVRELRKLDRDAAITTHAVECAGAE